MIDETKFIKFLKNEISALDREIQECVDIKDYKTATELDGAKSSYICILDCIEHNDVWGVDWFY